MYQENEFQEITAFHRKSMLRLLVRVSVYYIIVAVLCAAVIKAFPTIVDELPIGGISEFTNFDDPGVYELEESLLNSDGDELEEIAEQTQKKLKSHGPVWLSSAKSLFYAMFTTVILMIPVSWVYKTIHEGSDYDHSIDETALVLPSVVAGIVTIVQHSLALAFSLAGIVAGVRFRRALSDTFDTLFIFVAIGVGLAAGVNSVEIAIVITVFFNYVTLLMCTFGDGLESQYLARKKHIKMEKKATQILTPIHHEESSGTEKNNPAGKDI